MLDPEFVLDDAARERLVSRFGAGTLEWCAALPGLVGRCCSRWDLQLENAQSGSTSRVYRGRQGGRIDELSGLIPGLDADRLWTWCRASAVIIAVQHLHHRPADDTIPFLLELAAH
jgi:hypothetical protein